jgi:hypothetical protein
MRKRPGPFVRAVRLPDRVDGAEQNYPVRGYGIWEYGIQYGTKEEEGHRTLE